MSNSWTIEEKKHIVNTAQEMLDGKINFIEGSRILSKYSKDVYSDDNNVFLPFLAIWDESDNWPLGDAQKNCAKVYLEKINREVKEYLEAIEAETRLACQKIIDQFSN